MSFPLPEHVQAADLELYIREDQELVISKSLGGHYFYSYHLEEDEGDRIDPRLLVRPSAPVFDGHGEDEDEEEAMVRRFQERDMAADGKDALQADLWLEDVPVVDDADFEDLLAQKRGWVPSLVENHRFPSQEELCRPMDVSGSEESGSEDGEGETLFEVVSFGRNRVGMSFLAYKPEWNDAYDYILKDLDGLFYCPHPRPRRQGWTKPKSQVRRKRSRMQDPNKNETERKVRLHSRASAADLLQPLRARTNKTAPPPLRVRLLSASLQSRAIAARDVLFQHNSSSEPKGLLPPKDHHEGSESHELAESLNGWELRAIESLFELERL